MSCEWAQRMEHSIDCCCRYLDNLNGMTETLYTAGYPSAPCLCLLLSLSPAHLSLTAESMSAESAQVQACIHEYDHSQNQRLLP